jgi:endonuclease/exonuclease/phosphatase (EEP) superfamily protein YafD
MSKKRRAFGWLCIGGSLLLCILTVWAYIRLPDSLAGLTVYPIWFWGGIGLLMSVLALFFLRDRRSLIVTAVWAVTLSLTMDEAKVLLNFNHPKLAVERSEIRDGQRIIRVATVNCADFQFGDPVDEIKRWDPDIVLLQQALPFRVKRIAEILYGGNGNFSTCQTNGIVTRFEIRREVQTPMLRDQQVTIRLPEGTEIEVVNVHLAVAITDMRFWRAGSRAGHRANREYRSKELAFVLQALERSSSSPTTPTILGGDFNASATDIVHRQLDTDFDDAFEKVGRGWGNTFHRRFPILRIDHIYVTRQFQPLSSGVVVTKTTDHRMVIADLLLGR